MPNKSCHDAERFVKIHPHVHMNGDHLLTLSLPGLLCTETLIHAIMPIRNCFALSTHASLQVWMLEPHMPVRGDAAAAATIILLLFDSDRPRCAAVRGCRSNAGPKGACMKPWSAPMPEMLTELLCHRCPAAVGQASASSCSRFLTTFLPASRLARRRRSLGRWQPSLAWPKGTISAGAPTSFSSADATAEHQRMPVGFKSGTSLATGSVSALSTE